MMRFWRTLVFVLLLAGCGGGETPAPPAALPSSGSLATFRHEASGLVFPAVIGAFRRVDIFRQDPAGSSLSVGYAMASDAGPVSAIVHVYPAASAGGGLALFADDEVTTPERSAPQLAALEAEMGRLHAGFRIDSETDAFLLQDGRTQGGREALLSYDDAATAAPGRVAGRVVTDAYAFCCRHRNRAVIYRFQYRQDGAALALPIADFMRSLQWTSGGGGGDAPAPRAAAPPMPH